MLIHIDGERFEMETEGQWVYVTHPLWSLTGAGDTLARAIVDLRRRAGIHARSLLDGYPNLTLRAHNMFAFCLEAAIWDATDEDGDCQCFLCAERH
jgi:hypothetical protein